jgi:hypothetical protein
MDLNVATHDDERVIADATSLQIARRVSHNLYFGTNRREEDDVRSMLDTKQTHPPT